MVQVELSKPMILVVDDDPSTLRLADELLKDDYRVYLAPSGGRALHFLEGRRPDLIFLDLAMPDMDGYEVLRRVKSDPRWRDIPVIFLTAMEGRERELKALELGAADYILKPISAGVIKARAGLHIDLVRYRKLMQREVDRKTAQLSRTQDVMLNMLANMAAIRDQEEGSVARRTTAYSELLIRHLQQQNLPGYRIPEDYAQDIIKSARLYDIGKVAVPDNILLKPEHLSEPEFETVKRHTLTGAQILDNALEGRNSESRFLNVAREIITCHHEKWDGTGYPYGLTGAEIPLSGRIVAIVDVYEALVSRRPYKPSFPHGEAVQTIRDGAGTHFDPTLISASEGVWSRFAEVAL